MKKRDFQELRKKDIKDLIKIEEEKRKEIARSWSEIKAGREKNVKKVKNLRRDLARILTLIKEKQIIESEMKK